APATEKSAVPANARARADAAKRMYELGLERMRKHTAMDSEYLQRWSVRWLQAERDLAPNRAEDAASLRQHVLRMRELNELVGKFVQARQATEIEEQATQFYVLEAEDWLSTALRSGD
ncbi:MAG TPA: hypothetical protein VL475_06465, partial [Planctomycetaceae bacterium]|nr:hypothetical protein [Planctomycetaceae bacterium]